MARTAAKVATRFVRRFKNAAANRMWKVGSKRQDKVNRAQTYEGFGKASNRSGRALSVGNAMAPLLRKQKLQRIAKVRARKTTKRR